MTDPAFQALVDSFTRKLPVFGGEIRDAIRSGDTAKIKLLAHRLRGTAPSYGFPVIGSIAGELEEALRLEEAISGFRPKAERLAAALLAGDYR